MPIPLARRPIEVPVRDADATRKWLMERVRQEVLVKGGPHPKVLLLGHGFEETLDLDAMSKKDRGAHGGATFQALRSRPNVVRRFVEMLMTTGGDDEAERTYALLFEELDGFDGRRWWMATLEFTQDHTTGIGRPAAAWVQSNGETNDPADLLPFLREIAMPPPGSRAAEFTPPPDQWQPDIQFAFGELAAAKPAPSTAKQMVELAMELATNDLLTGKVQGAVVVRVAGREWEFWILRGEMPASLEEMARFIANHREPVAEGVAIALIAVRPQDRPPVLGLQVIGELGGKYCEAWAPIECPQGPSGPKHVHVVHWWDDRPVDEGGMWLGVRSSVEFEDPSPEA